MLFLYQFQFVFVDNIFTLAEQCLQTAEIGKKLTLTLHASKCAKDGRLSFESRGAIRAIDSTVFPDRPRLLPPKKMPQRSVNTENGRAAFFHALAHIEFIAIYLAWDIIYRFRGLPEQFYRDWLRVADEEAQHFSLLQAHLANMHTAYGDFPAHSGLWDHATDTADNLLARLALVPRCLEARGLDVTPGMIEKFRMLDDSASVAILERIFDDELGHVKLGSYWFKYFCDEQGYEPESHYRLMLKKYFKGKPRGPFNREMRIIAGFSNDEIDWLESGTNE